MPELAHRDSLSRWLAFAARAILFIIFAASAAAKLSAPGLFEADVTAYHLLPSTLVPGFAFAVPWLEAMVALYLFIGLFLRPAAFLAAGMLIIFIGALALNYVTGNVNHSCGCLQGSGLLSSLPILTRLFGGSTITLFDVARDLVLAGCAAVIYFGDHSLLSLDGLLFSDKSTEPATAIDVRSDEMLSGVDHGSRL